MQEVYKSGERGEVQDFDLGVLEKALSNPAVDHVRVFDKETGGRIDVEASSLKQMIVDAVGEALAKQKIMDDYGRLTDGR